MKKRGKAKPKNSRPKSKTRPRGKNTFAQSPKRVDIPLDELKAIVNRVKELGLEVDDLKKLDAAVDTLGLLTRELETKGTTIHRLRELIFGTSGSSEKTKKVEESIQKAEADKKKSEESAEDNSAKGDTSPSENKDETPKPPRKGHGRRKSSEYTGAAKVKIDHGHLKHGDQCPACLKGKVYVQKEPSYLVRVTGVAPIDATVYEIERLRCNLCGEVFTADHPEGVGEEKYDIKARAMIILLKYGCGLPFNRLAKLEASLGIPLPASTQWDLVLPIAEQLMPIYTEFIRQAAQGKVLYNDDTTARILKLKGVKNGPYVIEDDDIDEKRTGIFTTGIVSSGDNHQIALFFTSRKHAGENLETVLKMRLEELAPPIQMSDGSSRNTDGDFDTIDVDCNAHARRKFVEVSKSFPEEVLFVLKKYEQVYANEKVTKKQGMSDEERLDYHQEHSAPIMKELETWLNKQIDEKIVESNSSLGKAINYAIKHWPKLTLFLKIPGAPMDNNICERILKKAILHRKNALFFKTKNGAFVGDLFMTFIHTTELADENPFDYIVALLENIDLAAQNPSLWMPWNFREALNSRPIP